MEQTISVILLVWGAYLVIGLVFSIVFISRGLSEVDEGAKGSKLGFKLLIIPGMLIFWPLFAKKWRD
ncbi:MAG: hypothetical protein MI700_05175, partial [Balneolales bacterium]|nr:hypothetical protein [Balneolales bacterium]